jgi:hypothetical protein
MIASFAAPLAAETVLPIISAQDEKVERQLRELADPDTVRLQALQRP